MRVHLIRLLGGFCALATAVPTSRLIGPISAQSLGAPTFTTAQQSAGDAIYQESCASCHGKNLDDSEFGPPLKGVEFRSAWFGRSADVVFAKIETMPPAAPGSLGAEKHASLLAYLMSQNQLIASARPLPTDIDRLRAMSLPGATGGPSGGLSPNAVLPPGPAVVNPLDRYTPVTDAMLQTPPAAEWPTWRRGYDGQGFSPLYADQQEQRRHAARRVELGTAQRPQRKHTAVS
jgi:alcohol dehydrogenase (cytochrome c)